MTANQFWDWFQENEAFIRKELEDKDPDNSPTIEDFGNILHEYEPNLCYILARTKKPNKKCKVTISTGGNKNYIVAVKHLVSQAPKMEHWKARAFIPPIKKINKKYLNAPIVLDGQTIKIKDIKTVMTDYFEEEKMFEFTFVLPLSFANRNQETIRTMLQFLLEAVLGEFKMLEKIMAFQISYQMEDSYYYETIKGIERSMEAFESYQSE